MNKKTFKELGDFLGMAIAMDKYGSCYAFESIPKKQDGCWYNGTIGTRNYEVTSFVKKPLCDWEDLYTPECMKPRYKPLEVLDIKRLGELVKTEDMTYKLLGCVFEDNKVLICLCSDIKATVELEITTHKVTLEDFCNKFKWCSNDEPCGELIVE